MSYRTVMCVLHVVHVVVLCVETVLLYAALCHYHDLPRVQVTHISTAENACTHVCIPCYHGLSIMYVTCTPVLHITILTYTVC